MKICQVTPYWEAKGGIGTVVRNLSKHLLALDNEVYILSSDIKESSGNFIKLSSDSINKNLEIFKTLKNLKPDVIHVHAHGTLLPGALLYKKLINKNTKILCTYHTKPTSENVIESTNYNKRSKMRNKIVNYMANKIDYNVFVSKDLVKSYRDHMDLYTKKNYIIYNGIDKPNVNDKLMEDRKKELKIGTDELIISMVSTFQWDLKVVGIGKLLKAFDKFNKNVAMNSKLFIAGDGQYRYYIENILKEVNNTNIILLGNINYVNDLLYLSDIYAHTSPLEGCCMSILEAMAMGKNILTVKGGGNEELVVDKYSGIVVDFNEESIYDGLSYLYNNLKHLQLGEKALIESNERFSWERITREYLDLYLGKGTRYEDE